MSTSHNTPIGDIPKIHERARQAYRSGKAKSIAFRKEQIAQVGYMLRDNEQRFIEAAKVDLGRPAHETLLIDFAAVYIDVRLMYDNVEKWTKPRRVAFNLNFAAMNPRVHAEPKGVVLVIAPYNVPIFLSMSPLVGAIAGGNSVVLKPSEHTPATAKLISELVPKYLDPEIVQVVNGGAPETTAACVSPEYVLVPEDFQETFVAAVQDVYKSFYPDGPKNSDSFARMASEARAARLKRLIDETRGTIVFGGDVDIPQRYVGPTLVKDVRPDDVLMESEIFGPILVVVPVKDVDEALEVIRAKDKPLAIYTFSPDAAFLKKVFENTESGAALANEVFIHLGVPGLPAGGIGASGYGYYTGKEMFEQFTHFRVSLNNPSWY
ncbi:hypothetical protein BN946_scf184787.g6 [Trametes cinnabarina]|uniref:Aldehyde dehydrogenase domain-containing protein n=1 Tax=Pycnoporus cinnabarinus TaxID=5643 RepID=A0A060SS64_PYCCI|nr:hypothetical protein BN946_scf184787.g6 [Trametes cinnabarina]